MPKKTVKNAFFYFMIDFREAQKAKGIRYPNMTEVQQAADPVWKVLDPSVRTEYVERANKEKGKHASKQSKIENQERLAKEVAERELKDIQNFVQQTALNNRILDEEIYLIDLNAFCETICGYVFAEVALLRFNIRSGIIDQIHYDINPPKIPIGYGSDIKINCEELALNYPHSGGPQTDYRELLEIIIDYLKEGDKSAKIPPLFTMPDKKSQAVDFFNQLCNAANNDETIIRVYRLDTLFFYLYNAFKKHSFEGFATARFALASLQKHTFTYSTGMGCEHHETVDRSPECTRSRVRRWAFLILYECCQMAGVQIVLGRHVPEDTHVNIPVAVEKEIENGQNDVEASAAL